MAAQIRLNGQTVSVSTEGDVALLYVLRNELGINGPKFGCGLGQCGACTVLLNGAPVRSCLTPLSAAADK